MSESAELQRDLKLDLSCVTVEDINERLMRIEELLRNQQCTVPARGQDASLSGDLLQQKSVLNIGNESRGFAAQNESTKIASHVVDISLG